MSEYFATAAALEVIQPQNTCQSRKSSASTNWRKCACDGKGPSSCDHFINLDRIGRNFLPTTQNKSVANRCLCLNKQIKCNPLENALMICMQKQFFEEDAVMVKFAFSSTILDDGAKGGEAILANFPVLDDLIY